MDKLHRCELTLRWTGNRGEGTATYRAYSRDHELGGKGKGAAIEGSSDPALRGNAARYNPEELLVGAAAACHMLWFLHLCAAAGVVVTSYEDAPVAEMVEHSVGAGEFTRIELRPRVTVAETSAGTDLGPIHATAHAKCFVARSLRCDVWSRCRNRCNESNPSTVLTSFVRRRRTPKASAVRNPRRGSRLRGGWPGRTFPRGCHSQLDRTSAQ